MVGGSIFQAPMNPARARIAARLEHFLRVASFDLPETYGLALQGSWATAEYHAIEENGIIRSYSDVDFICSTPLQSSEQMAVEEVLHRAAASCNLQLQGISIRPADEMRNMWTLHSHGDNQEKCRKLQREFIQFWTLIGAIEVCAAWLFSEDSLLPKQHYHLNKFFLGIWRDLGIVSGHRLESYWETVHYAARCLSADVCNASYALKLGIETTVPWGEIRSAHQSSILKEFRCHMQSHREHEWIQSIVNDLMKLERVSARSWADEMLEYARNLEGDLAVRMAARSRLSKKLARGTRGHSDKELRISCSS